MLFPEKFDVLVSLLGYLSQAASALLFAFIFLLLCRLADRRDYFLIWSWSWVFLSLGVILLLPYLSLDTAILDLERIEASKWAQLSYGSSLLGRFMWLLLILGGTLSFTGPLNTRRFFLGALPIVITYVIVCVVITPEFFSALVWFAFPSILILIYCAWLLFRLPYRRRTLGVRALGSVLAINAIMWLLYYFAFKHMATELSHIHSGWRLTIIQYSSYFDVLIFVSTAFAMILVLMEDTMREMRAAMLELEVSQLRLKRDAYFDALTCAYTRRAFEEGYGLDAAQANYGSVVLFDLDDMKVVNDKYGHATGDKLLQYFAEVLQTALRRSDKLYRWGGDEFLMVMPRAAPTQALVRMQSVLEKARPFQPNDSEQGYRLKVSMGTALFHGDELLEAVEQADKFMYEDKQRRKADAE